MVSTPDKTHYRGEHDPYNNMESANIRPDNIARQELRDAERNASKKTNVGSNSVSSGSARTRETLSDSIKSSEQDQSSNYLNSVRGKNNKNGKKKGLLRRTGPVGIITALLIGGGAFFYGAQSMLGPHLSALYTNATDVQFSSYNFRNARLMSYMLDGGGQIKISNFTKKYTYFTPYMQSRLRSNGIEVGHIDSSGNFKSGQAVLGTSTVLKYGDQIVDANSFQDTFASNANFREAYYDAKRGRVAGFFDDVSIKYYDQKGATRDIFDEYKSTGDLETDTDAFEDTVSHYVVGADGKVNTVGRYTDEETGEEHTQHNGSDINTGNVDGATPEAKAR
jgi:hypothetical protein